uniref:MSTP105 n=1 Tax=Homo sapiens TaxID=9606 RepID=Q7Z4D4_HUMAN|nr:MSTP105 [Homo sapiens]
MLNSNCQICYFPISLKKVFMIILYSFENFKATFF